MAGQLDSEMERLLVARIWKIDPGWLLNVAVNFPLVALDSKSRSSEQLHIVKFPSAAFLDAIGQDGRVSDADVLSGPCVRALHRRNIQFEIIKLDDVGKSVGRINDIV